MNRRGFKCLVMGGLAVLAFGGCGGDAPESALTRKRLVADFTLTDSFGRPVARSELTGKVSVVGFFLSTCAASSISACSHLAEIQRRTAEQPDVQLFSITVDPVGDQPQTLREVGAKFRAETNRWRFLTGRRGDVERLIKHSFLSAAAIEKYQRTGANPLTDQCDQIVIVDRDGWVRGHFDGTRFSSVTRVLEAVAQLRSEAATSSPSDRGSAPVAPR